MTTTPRAVRPPWALPLLAWIAHIAVAIALGVYAEAPGMAAARGGGRLLPRLPGPPPDVPALLWTLGVGSVVWYAAALALPLVLWVARRVDPERLGRARVTALVAVGVLALVTATAAAEYFITYRGVEERPGPSRYLMVAVRQHLLPWVALTALAAVFESRRRARHAQVERERLRAQVAEQRLVALTGQLHPHFLFNTLQGISTLIHRDPNAAEEMLAKLADLLRDLLRHRDRVFVPLEDEVRYTRTYLEISQLRFGDRLSFEIDVPAALRQEHVPLFILQPLVENALGHGIGGVLRGGRVVLRAERRGDRLVIEVEDDGAGLPTGAAPREGIGLANTRERLRASFGDDQSLVLEPRQTGGVVARIDIPLRRQ